MSEGMLTLFQNQPELLSPCYEPGGGTVIIGDRKLLTQLDIWKAYLTRFLRRQGDLELFYQ